MFAADPRYVARKAKVMAGRPPLTAAQIAALRPICLQMLPYMKAAAERRDPDGGSAEAHQTGGDSRG